MLELCKRHSFCPLGISFFISLQVASTTSIDLCHRSQHTGDGLWTPDSFWPKRNRALSSTTGKPWFIRAKMAAVIIAYFGRKITYNVTAIRALLTCQIECRTNPTDLFLICIGKELFGKGLKSSYCKTYSYLNSHWPLYLTFVINLFWNKHTLSSSLTASLWKASFLLPTELMGTAPHSLWGPLRVGTWHK